MEYRIMSKKKKSLSIREIPCYLLVLSLFFPIRGSILGLGFYHVIGLAFIIYLCSLKTLKTSIHPSYLWVYGLTLVGMDLYWFQPDRIWWYFSNLLPFFAAFLFIPHGIQTEDALNHFLDFIISVFAVYSVSCIIESVTYFNIFDFLTNTRISEYTFTNEIRFGFVRNRGALDISINNGMILCMALSVCAYRLLQEKKRKHLIAYGLIMLASFMSFSRSVWLQIMVSQLLIIMTIPSVKKIKVILGATGILLLILLIGTVLNAEFAVGIAGIVDNMVASFLSIFIGKNDSELIGIGHRFLLWPWVYETVKDNIIFGFGVGAPVAVKTTLGYTKVSIEVAWLATLYYTGLIGLFGLITYQFGCMKHALRRIKKKLFGLHYKNINYYFLTATIAYFIVLFSCNFGEDMRFHYIFLALVMCCNRGHFGYDAFGLSRKED